MAELKCPHCGKTFEVDDTAVNSIVSQIRDQEFDKTVSTRVKEMEKHLSEVHEAEIEARESRIRLSVQEEHDTRRFREERHERQSPCFQSTV